MVSPLSSSHEADPLVTVVMPALNEEHHIVAALDSISRISDALPYEILVMDGGSTDRTRALVEDYSRKNPRIKLVPNEKRLQSAAVNKAAIIAAPSSKILIRADCHSLYPEGFVEGCATTLQKTGAASVVVPMDTIGTNFVQKGVAAAQNSRLGNGGAAHRNRGQSRFVEHGHHAAFDREMYQKVGGYDESFSHNEDAELDLRIAQAGGKIWLEDSLAITYFPRSTLSGLARQYFNFGKGRARNAAKHRQRLRVRQMAPMIIGAGCLGGVLLAALLHPLFLAIPVAYLGMCLGWGLLAALRQGDPSLIVMGPAAIVMHFAWAAGFLRFTAWKLANGYPN